MLLFAAEHVCDDVLDVCEHMRVYGLFQSDWMEIKVAEVLHMVLQSMIKEGRQGGKECRRVSGSVWMVGVQWCHVH